MDHRQHRMSLSPTREVEDEVAAHPSPPTYEEATKLPASITAPPVSASADPEHDRVQELLATVQRQRQDLDLETGYPDEEVKQVNLDDIELKPSAKQGGKESDSSSDTQVAAADQDVRRNLDSGSEHEEEDDSPKANGEENSSMLPTSNAEKEKEDNVSKSVDVYLEHIRERMASGESILFQNGKGASDQPNVDNRKPRSDRDSDPDERERLNSTPPGFPESDEEEVPPPPVFEDEMEANVDVETQAEPRRRSLVHMETFQMEDGDVEDGRRETHSKIQFRKIHLIVTLVAVLVIGLLLLVTLLPVSFVYVDYDKMGFAKSTYSGIDYSHVYEMGCYLEAPQISMVLLPSTAQLLDLDIHVFDRNGLTIGLTVYLQYFLRRSELSNLYQKYNEDYANVVSTKADSIVKNMAPLFTLEEFRLNRSVVEAELFKRMRYALAGDCCHNLNNKRFPARFHDKGCNSSASCHRGFHVDVGYFQMGAVTIPDRVSDRLLKQVILELEYETEFHIQEKALVVKQTELNVQTIRNQAKEIMKNADAEANTIRKKAEASSLKETERSYISALTKVMSRLNLTKEEDKMSLIYLRTLETIKSNLVAFSYNYDSESFFSPP